MRPRWQWKNLQPLEAVWALLQPPVGSDSVRMDRVSQRLGGKGRPTPAHSSPGGVSISASSAFRRFCGNKYLRNVVIQGILLLRAVTHNFLGAVEEALDPGVLRSACAGAANTREIERGALLANG